LNCWGSWFNLFGATAGKRESLIVIPKIHQFGGAGEFQEHYSEHFGPEQKSDDVKMHMMRFPQLIRNSRLEEQETHRLEMISSKIRSTHNK